MSEKTLEGQVSVVTGAARGIGLAIAERFAEEGSDLILIDKLEDKLREVSKELEGSGVKVQTLVQDITKIENIRKILDKTKNNYDSLDVLVNCAGVALLDNAESLSLEDWEKTLEVNLTAPFLLSQAFFEALKKGGGKIVNIASQAAVVGIEEHAAYCTSKSGLLGLTKVLALEWGQYDININAVSPTVVMTELGEEAWKGEKGKKMKEKIPVGRFAQPEEIAQSVLFLASNEADMINGENLVVDGGYTIK